MPLRRLRQHHEAIALSILLVAILINAPALIVHAIPPVITYNKLPIEVKTPAIRPGEPLVLLVDRCGNDPFSSNTRIFYTYTRSIVNTSTNERITLPPGQSDLKVGCERFESRVTVIPPDTQPGRYYLEGVAMARGSWRDDLVYYKTEDFEIVRG